MSASATPPVVLTFAATDPTGGAGIQADLLTVAALGCHPLSVITAITVQDTRGVQAIHAVAAEQVTAQARAVLADIPVQAFKVGFVGSAANVAAIGAIVAAYPRIPVVLDPVLASGRGDSMADADTVRALCQLLLPHTTLLTPNSNEARRLVGGDASAMSLDQCAQRLLRTGCSAVLITGTHEDTAEVLNTLYSAQASPQVDAWPRLDGSYHGSGCTLASACAALLAAGRSLADASREAQQYTWQTLASGFTPGAGQHIPDRLWRYRATAKAASR